MTKPNEIQIPAFISHIPSDDREVNWVATRDFLPKFVFGHMDQKIPNQSPKPATFPYKKLDTKLGTGAQDKQAFCVDLEVQQSSSTEEV